jgi:hypothetical protein
VFFAQKYTNDPISYPTSLYYSSYQSLFLPCSGQNAQCRWAIRLTCVPVGVEQVGMTGVLPGHEVLPQGRTSARKGGEASHVVKKRISSRKGGK